MVHRFIDSLILSRCILSLCYVPDIVLSENEKIDEVWSHCIQVTWESDKVGT